MHAGNQESGHSEEVRQLRGTRQALRAAHNAQAPQPTSNGTASGSARPSLSPRVSEEHAVQGLDSADAG